MKTCKLASLLLNVKWQRCLKLFPTSVKLCCLIITNKKLQAPPPTVLVFQYIFECWDSPPFSTAFLIRRFTRNEYVTVRNWVRIRTQNLYNIRKTYCKTLYSLLLLNVILLPNMKSAYSSYVFHLGNATVAFHYLVFNSVPCPAFAERVPTIPIDIF